MKTRYRYLGCVDGTMMWESVGQLPGDSRHEVVTCTWEWFWARRV